MDKARPFAESGGENEDGTCATKKKFFLQVSHIHNSPKCICEAMLLGMPVVYSDDCSSLLTNALGGFLLPDHAADFWTANADHYAIRRCCNRCGFGKANALKR